MPTAYSNRLIIVILESDANLANTHAKAVDVLGGENTFTAKLSPTGDLPATNRWCNWAMTDAERADLGNRFNNLINTGRVKVYDALVTTPEQVLAELGLKPISMKIP